MEISSQPTFQHQQGTHQQPDEEPQQGTHQPRGTGQQQGTDQQQDAHQPPGTDPLRGMHPGRATPQEQDGQTGILHHHTTHQSTEVQVHAAYPKCNLRVSRNGTKTDTGLERYKPHDTCRLLLEMTLVLYDTLS